MGNRGCALPREMGEIDLLTVADPGAGNQYAFPLFTVPAGEIWLIVGVGFKLQCDANVANRYAHFGAYPSGMTHGLQFAPFGSAMTASNSYECNGAIGQGYGTGNGPGGGDVIGPNARLTGLPTWILLYPGDRGEIYVRQFQGGDALVDCEIVYMKWRTVSG